MTEASPTQSSKRGGQLAKSEQTGNDLLATSFGRAVTHQRELAGLSIAELARKASMQRAYVWRVEQGTTLPNLRNAARLALALNIPLTALVANLDTSELFKSDHR